MSTSKGAGRGGNPLRLLALTIALILGGLATMFGVGAMHPKLAIDLAGGTSVTLTAKPLPDSGGGGVTKDAMNQAVEIIRQRVNGFGVSEAQVTTLGSDNIVVSVPGKNSQDVVNKVGRTALLRFRPVLLAGGPQPGGALPDLSELTKDIEGLDDETPDSLGGTDASPTPSAKASGKASAKPKASASPTADDSNRAMTGAVRAADDPSPGPTASATPTAAASATPTKTPKADKDKDKGAGDGKAETPGEGQSGIPKAVQDKYAALDCLDPAARQGGDQESPDAVVVACDKDGVAKYILGPSAVQGTQVSNAEAGLPQGVGVGNWLVNLTFNGEGAKAFADITTAIVNLPEPTNQLAVVLDGVVYSSPRIINPITDGNAQISGNFDSKSAKDLEKVLKYGALPLAFERSTVSTISASLGDEQLKGGLIAGGLGVALVVAYCIVFYRGLGVAALLGLVVAASMSYISVSLLGEAMNYRLSIAGIAGLIVAIGITADSFVVFFERLRDEIREGRSPRAAVEYGWIRARRTIISANFVSVLAAAVLYFFSVAEVKGFAFTLGVATLIDVVVIFLFTKPLVAVLMRRPFFARGHRLSGVNPENLGIKRSARPNARVGQTKEA